MAPFDSGKAHWKNTMLLDPSCSQCDIRDAAFCKGVPERETARLETIATFLDIESGETIISEADPAEHIFNVTGGAVKLYKLMTDGRRQITGFLFPGSFLGVSNHSEYAYTAEALTPTSLCRFPLKQFEALLGEFPLIGQRMVSIMMDDLAGAQSQMLLLGRKTARERVASFLVLLAERTGVSAEATPLLPIPMNRVDIADFLGLTIETVSRTLTGLKKDGFIAIPDGGHIQVLDMDHLVTIAEHL